ncbi:hypothetical protein [Niveispirillum sp. BGYR6]|uniref:hypothetical protein n=1 Tax=Niveispirillum sp. BGYR6 TaxID=2971249 RepID=UPI0022B9B693|nr:hypothetical protein [Niveispirillum sp. BGYR6]MDG5495910.1 hypothetical protein [Niveispirillum sp. BGYR6]
MTPPTLPATDRPSAHLARLLRHGPERAKAALLLLLLALAGGLGLAGLPGAEAERAGTSANANSSAGRSPISHAVLVVATVADQSAPAPAGAAGGPVLSPAAPALPPPAFAGLLLLGLGLCWVGRSIRTGPRQPTGPPWAFSR